MITYHVKYEGESNGLIRWTKYVKSRKCRVDTDKKMNNIQA